MKKIRLLIFVFVVLACGGPSWAQLVIQDSRVQLDVAPGTTVMNSTFVQNSSNQAVEVKVYWQDFVYVPSYYDGAKKFSPPGSSDYSCSSWVTYSPQNFTLPPYGKERVKYSFSVPEGFKGGCDGVLFFELGAQPVPGQVGVNIITRTGALFFLESQDKNKNATVSDLVLTGTNMTGRLTNAGDVVLFPEGTYYILNKDGLVEDRGTVAKLYLPPGKGADFEGPINGKIKPGAYTFILTFDLGAGDSAVKEVDYVKADAGEIAVVATRD